MPIDYSKYAANWHEISKDIRKNRAGHACECRGECGHDHNKEWLAILAVSELHSQPDRCMAHNHACHWFTGSTTVLTVAHLDHDIKNNDYSNLMAMCQRCHLAYDRNARKKCMFKENES